jgi:hypothetical protein
MYRLCIHTWYLLDVSSKFRIFVVFETLDLQTIFRIKRYAQVQDAGKIVRAFTVYFDKKFHTPQIVIAMKMKS